MLVNGSSHWDPVSVFANPKLQEHRPKQGIELWRRNNNIPSESSRVLIVGPPIFVRQLHIPEATVKLWLDINSKRLCPVIQRYRRALPPNREWPQVCLVLCEFFTETWTVVQLDAHPKNESIALGLSSDNEKSGRWDVLQLTKPTVRPSMGTGNWEVR